MVLHKTHFAGAVNTLREGTTFIISAARLYSLPVRSWKKEFLALVRSAGEKDLEYCKAIEELKAEENGEAAWAGSVLDDREAEENKGNEKNEEAARVGSVLNGRMAKDRKTTQAGKGIIEMKDGCVYRKGMLWIPNDKDLIRQILESEYNTKVAGHRGQDKTIELI